MIQKLGKACVKFIKAPEFFEMRPSKKVFWNLAEHFLLFIAFYRIWDYFRLLKLIL